MAKLRICVHETGFLHQMLGTFHFFGHRVFFGAFNVHFQCLNSVIPFHCVETLVLPTNIHHFMAVTSDAQRFFFLVIRTSWQTFAYQLRHKNSNNYNNNNNNNSSSSSNDNNNNNNNKITRKMLANLYLVSIHARQVTIGPNKNDSHSSELTSNMPCSILITWLMKLNTSNSKGRLELLVILAVNYHFSVSKVTIRQQSTYPGT